MLFSYHVCVHTCSVSPLKGTVPGSGSVDITIQFRPPRKISAEMLLQINIAQFNFTPITCKVSGGTRFENSVHADAERLFQKTALFQAYQQHTQDKARDLAASRRLTTSLRPRLEGSARRKHNKIRSQALSRTSMLQMRHDPTNLAPLPVTVVRLPDGEEVRVPTKVIRNDRNGALNSHFLASYILTQQPGKMKIAELKECIDARSKELSAIDAEVDRNVSGFGAEASGRAKNGGGTNAVTHTVAGLGYAESVFDYSSTPNDAIDFKGETPQVQLMIFYKLKLAASNYEKFLQVNPTKMRVGQASMEQARVSSIEDNVFSAYHRAVEARRAGDRATYTQPNADARVLYQAKSTPPCEPKWDQFDNDKWLKQKASLHRFMQSAAKLVIRRRCTKRLDAVKQTILAQKRANQNKKRDFSYVSGSDEALVRPPSQFAAQFKRSSIRTFSFPVFESNRTFHEDIHIDQRALPAFDFTPEASFERPWDYQIAGYRPHELGAVPSFLPPELSRPLRTGATEEQLHRGQRGLPVAADVTATFLDGDRPFVDTTSAAIASSTTSTAAVATATAALAASAPTEAAADPVAGQATARKDQNTGRDATPLSGDSELSSVRQSTAGVRQSTAGGGGATRDGLATAATVANKEEDKTSRIALPGYLLEPYPYRRNETLSSDPRLVARAQLLPFAETDPAHAFLAAPIQSQSRYKSQADTLSVFEMDGILTPTLSSIWRPAQQTSLCSVDCSEFGMDMEALPAPLTAADSAADVQASNGGEFDDVDEFEVDVEFTSEYPTLENAASMFSRGGYVVSRDNGLADEPESKDGKKDKKKKDPARRKKEVAAPVVAAASRTDYNAPSRAEGLSIMNKALTRSITRNVYTLTKRIQALNRVTHDHRVLTVPAIVPPREEHREHLHGAHLALHHH
jgi:hypothetical protein